MFSFCNIFILEHYHFRTFSFKNISILQHFSNGTFIIVFVMQNALDICEGLSSVLSKTSIRMGPDGSLLNRQIQAKNCQKSNCWFLRITLL